MPKASADILNNFAKNKNKFKMYNEKIKVNRVLLSIYIIPQMLQFFLIGSR